MGVNITNGVTAQTSTYAAYETAGTAKAAAEQAAAKNTEESTAAAAVYEKSESTSGKATYSVNKMSSEERAALVDQLKNDQAARQQQMVNIVRKMMGQQATSYANANDMWSFLAKGDFTVDAQTKLQAQQDIAEDGYYGIKQTSERLFDFASALAGDDVEKMKKMQEAMQKGFKQATGAWGKELPDICQKTMDAANKKFEDYYESKKTTAVEE